MREGETPAVFVRTAGVSPSQAFRHGAEARLLIKAGLLASPEFVTGPYMPARRRASSKPPTSPWTSDVARTTRAINGR